MLSLVHSSKKVILEKFKILLKLQTMNLHKAPFFIFYMHSKKGWSLSTGCLELSSHGRYYINKTKQTESEPGRATAQAACEVLPTDWGSSHQVPSFPDYLSPGSGPSGARDGTL